MKLEINLKNKTGKKDINMLKLKKKHATNNQWVNEEMKGNQKNS